MRKAKSRYVKIGVLLFVVFILIYYWSRIENLALTLLYAVTPLFGGFVIAYIVNIPMSFFERVFFGRCKSKAALKLKRPVCMLLSFIALAALIFVIVTMIVPELVSCVELLLEELPPVFEKLYTDLEAKYGFFEVLEEMVKKQFKETGDWKDIAEKAINFVFNGLGGVMGSVFTFIAAVFSTVLSVFMSFVFAVYLLSGKEKLGGGINRLLSVYAKPRFKQVFDKVFCVVDDCFHRFIVGQCTEAVILGLLCMIGMNIFGFPYATMIGTLIGFTALIPIAGAYIGAAVGAFMVFTADSFLKAVLFVVFIVILQQLEGNLIYPKVVGASIGLHGIWVLAAITIGGAISGIFGMLLGVAIAASIYKLVRMDMERRSHVDVDADYASGEMAAAGEENPLTEPGDLGNVQTDIEAGSDEKNAGNGSLPENESGKVGKRKEKKQVNK